MSDRIPLARAWRRALLLPVVALVSLLWRPSSHARHARATYPPDPPRASEPRAPRPPRAPRVRPYLPDPTVPPDYDRFCHVHTRHRARWRLTYEATQRAPYQAHNRVVTSIVLAAGDLETLEFALGEFTPPPYPRPYIDHHANLSTVSATTTGGGI